MDKGLPFDVSRPWGSFRQFTLATASTVKLVNVKPNESLSLQSHAKRSEFIRVLIGSGTLRVGDESYDLIPGSEHEIPRGIKHRTGAGGEGLTLLEISFGDFDEEDIIRYEDDYGRAQ